MADEQQPGQPDERSIETAEQERRRLDDDPAGHDRDRLDMVREQLRRHDKELREPRP